MMFAMANHTVDGKRIYPTLKAAKDALEKQMPKKTITRNGLVRTERGYELLDEKEQEYCSKCNRLVQPPCEKYCSYCGQAIYFE